MLTFSRGVSQIFVRLTRANNLNGNFHTSAVKFCAVETENTQADTTRETQELSQAELKRIKNDRTQVIPVETSIRYLKSAAYEQTYGQQPVWVQYRRNHLGMFAPRKTRKTCIRQGTISTGNPCPICRDEYLVLDHRNLDLLKQFISQETGKVLSYSKTGLCQKKHLELLVAVERARDYGLITYDVPYRQYDYSEYYKKPTNKQQQQQH